MSLILKSSSGLHSKSSDSLAPAYVSNFTSYISTPFSNCGQSTSFVPQTGCLGTASGSVHFFFLLVGTRFPQTLSSLALFSHSSLRSDVTLTFLANVPCLLFLSPCTPYSLPAPMPFQLSSGSCSLIVGTFLSVSPILEWRCHESRAWICLVQLYAQRPAVPREPGTRQALSY